MDIEKFVEDIIDIFYEVKEEYPYRFKPLRYDLKHYWRVYVKEPYVLV